jgi:hypothetical protein
MGAEMSDNPKGTYWPTWRRAVACAQSKKKNETFTDHQFHEECGIDYNTATKYLPLLVGRDLGGKKIIQTPVATKNGYMVDPPGQDSLELARLECCRRCGCDQSQKQDPSGDYSWMFPFVLTVCLMLPMFLFLSSRARR